MAFATAFQADAFNNSAFQVSSRASNTGAGGSGGFRSNEDTERGRENARKLDAAIEQAYRKLMGLEPPEELVAVNENTAIPDEVAQPAFLDQELVNAMIMAAVERQRMAMEDEEDIAAILALH